MLETYVKVPARNVKHAREYLRPFSKRTLGASHAQTKHFDNMLTYAHILNTNMFAFCHIVFCASARGSSFVRSHVYLWLPKAPPSRINNVARLGLNVRSIARSLIHRSKCLTLRTAYVSNAFRVAKHSNSCPKHILPTQFNKC